MLLLRYSLMKEVSILLGLKQDKLCGLQRGHLQIDAAARSQHPRNDFALHNKLLTFPKKQK